MERYAFVALASLILAGGCEKKGTEDHTGPAGDGSRASERERIKSLTPMDQSNSQPDLDTTQSIRKALMADDALSVNAKNLKVITSNGVVVIRGPVKSDAERVTVEVIARRYAGANRVEALIEVPSR